MLSTGYPQNLEVIHRIEHVFPSCLVDVGGKWRRIRLKVQEGCLECQGGSDTAPSPSQSLASLSSQPAAGRSSCAPWSW